MVFRFGIGSGQIGDLIDQFDKFLKSETKRLDDFFEFFELLSCKLIKLSRLFFIVDEIVHQEGAWIVDPSLRIVFDEVPLEDSLELFDHPFLLLLLH